MPTLLFLVHLLENGQYRCHARVRCGSEQELQPLLQQHATPNDLGWRVEVSRGPWRGYDGKPLYEAVLWFSKPLTALPPAVPACEPVVHDSVVDWPARVATEPEPPIPRDTDAVSWHQRMAITREINQLLRQIGITELGKWK